MPYGLPADAGSDTACDGLVRINPIRDGLRSREGWKAFFFVTYFFMESLILAQNERWQRGLGMQVEREAAFSIFGENLQRRVAKG